jgi:hypothetical protein
VEYLASHLLREYVSPYKIPQTGQNTKWGAIKSCTKAVIVSGKQSMVIIKQVRWAKIKTERKTAASITTIQGIQAYLSPHAKPQIYL